ncbi:MAG: hypothetical protein O3B95_09930, partial [Chloroflexi bacterium]|nr:hypothetical protein [Chloroflexota bacterium]
HQAVDLSPIVPQARDIVRVNVLPEALANSSAPLGEIFVGYRSELDSHKKLKLDAKKYPTTYATCSINAGPPHHQAAH